jgi:hypothetical protein
MGDSGGLGLQAQPFEAAALAHTGSAQALSLLTAKNKRLPEGSLLFWTTSNLAERVGFEPTVRSPVRLISSQVHSTTLPPLLVTGRCIRESTHYRWWLGFSQVKQARLRQVSTRFPSTHAAVLVTAEVSIVLDGC